jgi:hypothetical protein
MVKNISKKSWVKIYLIYHALKVLKD